MRKLVCKLGVGKRTRFSWKVGGLGVRGCEVYVFKGRYYGVLGFSKMNRCGMLR